MFLGESLEPLHAIDHVSDGFKEPAVLPRIVPCGLREIASAEGLVFVSKGLKAWNSPENSKIS